MYREGVDYQGQYDLNDGVNESAQMHACALVMTRQSRKTGLHTIIYSTKLKANSNTSSDQVYFFRNRNFNILNNLPGHVTADM